MAFFPPIANCLLCLFETQGWPELRTFGTISHLHPCEISILPSRTDKEKPKNERNFSRRTGKETTTLHSPMESPMQNFESSLQEQSKTETQMIPPLPIKMPSNNSQTVPSKNHPVLKTPAALPKMFVSTQKPCEPSMVTHPMAAAGVKGPNEIFRKPVPTPKKPKAYPLPATVPPMAPVHRATDKTPSVNTDTDQPSDPRQNPSDSAKEHVMPKLPKSSSAGSSFESDDGKPGLSVAASNTVEHLERAKTGSASIDMKTNPLGVSTLLTSTPEEYGDDSQATTNQFGRLHDQFDPSSPKPSDSISNVKQPDMVREIQEKASTSKSKECGHFNYGAFKATPRSHRGEPSDGENDSRSASAHYSREKTASLSIDVVSVPSTEHNEYFTPAADGDEHQARSAARSQVRKYSLLPSRDELSTSFESFIPECRQNGSTEEQNGENQAVVRPSSNEYSPLSSATSEDSLDRRMRLAFAEQDKVDDFDKDPLKLQ